MIKDNHIQAAGSIEEAVLRVRQNMPYPLTIEVETSQLEEVNQALQQQVEIIMLDNMDLEMMQTAFHKRARKVQTIHCLHVVSP